MVTRKSGRTSITRSDSFLSYLMGLASEKDVEKYVISWKIKGEGVELKVVYSNNHDELRPGKTLRIRRNEFEECVNRYRGLGSKRPEDEAVRDFVIYGGCR